MITPQLAAVRPRVTSPASGETIPLESAVADVLDGGDCLRIQIQGGPGSGKTTALRHVAAALAPLLNVVLLDDPSEEEIAAAASRASRVIFSGRKRVGDASITVLPLAPWNDDDLIEYLLAAWPGQCASVMQRLHDSPDKSRVQGNPALWRLTLDALAAHPALSGIRTAVQHWLPGLFRNLEENRIAGLWCLAIQVRDETSALRFLGQLAKRDEDFERIRLLRHPWIQRLLAAQHIVDCLVNPQPCGPLAQRLPEPLIQEVARHISPQSAAAKRLFRVVETEDQRYHAMAASILHASGSEWRPSAPAVYRLRGGYFPAAAWHGVQLSYSPNHRTDLTDADLTGADLSEARAEHACLHGARLARANLTRAILNGAVANHADLSGATLTEAIAAGVTLQHANLVRAKLDYADLREASLYKANLEEASLCGTNLSQALLLDAEIDDADFSGANLARAILVRLPLRKAMLRGASFQEATLSLSDLEGVELPAADFLSATLEGAYLTASILPRADFREADLRGAHLADIQWEGADLRGADLRGCSFHMGSTRSGLVGSPYPGHGSKTGFYTDDYYDQGYKAPEEIRKANLCGADLRGARIDDVDFYLVDLRGARFDTAAAEHLSRCGAILADRSV